MLLILWCVIVCGSVVFKTSRIYTSLIVLFGVLLFTFSNDNADSLNYFISYCDLKSGKNPVFSGNALSNLVFYIAGLFNDFKLSRFLFSSISFVLIYKGAKRYTENVNVVLGLFLIAPYVIDATQVKSMISMSVWFYFSYYLFEACRGYNERKNTIKYLIGVFIASEFHFSYVLTALYVLVMYLNKKKLVITACIVNALGFTAFGLTKINAFMDVFSALSNFQSAFLRLRGESVLVTETMYLYRIRTSALFYIFLLISYILLIPINNLQNVKTGNNFNLGFSEALGQFVFKLNIATLCFLPLLSISMELYRLQRDLLLIDYTYLAVLLFTYKFGAVRITFSNIWVIGIGFILAFYYLFIEAIYGNINTVFLPLFHMTR